MIKIDTENYDEEYIQLVKDYKEVFSGDTGKKVLEDLYDTFDISSYVKGDAYATAYREGRRAVILHIKSKVEAVFDG
jgi:hypothetical protein